MSIKAAYVPRLHAIDLKSRAVEQGVVTPMMDLDMAIRAARQAGLPLADHLRKRATKAYQLLSDGDGRVRFYHDRNAISDAKAKQDFETLQAFYNRLAQEATWQRVQAEAANHGFVLEQQRMQKDGSIRMVLRVVEEN